MAQNPQLFPNGMPVPFYAELFVLARDGVEFEVDKIPGSGKAKAKGTIYLSNIRMVFVAAKPVGHFFAFDMPLCMALLISVLEFHFMCSHLNMLFLGPSPSMVATPPSCTSSGSPITTETTLITTTTSTVYYTPQTPPC
ncbi:hypothetical protein KSS87_017676 [Heliosperma pusillum]|nr:hypothetical protein KSS87_017676 [Heliosperma pusillum]